MYICRTMKWVCWQRSPIYKRSWSICVCSVMTLTLCPQPVNKSSWTLRALTAVVCGTFHKYVSETIQWWPFFYVDNQNHSFWYSYPCIKALICPWQMYIQVNHFFQRHVMMLENWIWLAFLNDECPWWLFCFQHSPPSSPSSIGSRKSSMCSINSITSSSSGSIKSHSPSHLNHLRNSAQVSAAAVFLTSQPLL